MRYLIVHTEEASFEESVEWFVGNKGVGIAMDVATISDLMESGWTFQAPVVYVKNKHEYMGWNSYFVWHFYKE